MSDDRDRTRRELESDQLNQRGIDAADRRWFDEAVKAFKRAIELNPESAHAHDNLATVYSEQGEFLLALREYLEAIRLEPDSPTAHYNLACFLSTQGLDMAIDQYTKAIELDPDYPDAHVNLGLCHVDRGEHELAIEAFRNAISVDPDDLGARQDPKNLDALVDLGVAYSAQGIYSEAERALKAALDVAPDAVLVGYHLAALYAAWEHDEDALEHLARVIQYEPEQVRAWTTADRTFDALRHDPRLQSILHPQK